jgi:hypothetical protein
MQGVQERGVLVSSEKYSLIDEFGSFSNIVLSICFAVLLTLNVL